ncbi:MAG: CPBP family intramembrane metalloprotease [Gammaproteobacteria bacterium]|nr:CPBP family intramembrane metalloprotease [Gammaproteobacteria bacterium]
MQIRPRPSLRHRPDIWGPGRTLAFGVAIAAAFLLVQLGVIFACALYEVEHGQQTSVRAAAAGLSDNGLVFSLATVASAGACTVCTWGAARLRKGSDPADYLGMHRVPARALMAWLAVTLALMAVSDLVEPLIRNPQGPEFTLSLYRSATLAPLFWFAIVIAAPVFEELFFRGFLLQGLRWSRLGPVAAVILTALAWALSHAQYSRPEVAEIFIFGLFLGMARLRTDSIYPPIAMHAFVNLATLIQAAMVVGSH